MVRVARASPNRYSGVQERSNNSLCPKWMMTPNGIASRYNWDDKEKCDVIKGESLYFPEISIKDSKYMAVPSV